MTNHSTFQTDYKPFMLKSVDQNDEENSKNYFSNPLFINSTTYGVNFANWGSKPFERMREIGKKPFISKFYGESTYVKDFAKEDGKQLPPQFEREYEKKFKEEFRKKN